MRRMLGLALTAVVLLAAPLSAQVVEYYHLDALGSVRAVTDQSGAVVARYDYLPFGDEWCAGAVCGAPQEGQPRRFTAKERDTETGLDYFGARYYSGRVGRFTGVDPVMTIYANLADPQRWNRYAYGLNNPYRYVDPDGRQAVEQPSTLDQLWYEVNRHVRLNQVPNFNYQQGAAATPVAVDKDTVKKAAIVVGAAATAAAIAASREGSPGATHAYRRPSGATTSAQRAAVQGGTCVTCGEAAQKMFPDHKRPLVKEFYETGRIDRTRMRDVGSVQPQCPTCSGRQGAELSRYSKAKKKELGY